LQGAPGGGARLRACPPVACRPTKCHKYFYLCLGGSGAAAPSLTFQERQGGHRGGCGRSALPAGPGALLWPLGGPPEAVCQFREGAEAVPLLGCSALDCTTYKVGTLADGSQRGPLPTDGGDQGGATGAGWAGRIRRPGPAPSGPSAGPRGGALRLLLITGRDLTQQEAPRIPLRGWLFAACAGK